MTHTSSRLSISTQKTPGSMSCLPLPLFVPLGPPPPPLLAEPVPLQTLWPHTLPSSLTPNTESCLQTTAASSIITCRPATLPVLAQMVSWMLLCTKVLWAPPIWLSPSQRDKWPLLCPLWIWHCLESSPKVNLTKTSHMFHPSYLYKPQALSGIVWSIALPSITQCPLKLSLMMVPSSF